MLTQERPGINHSKLPFSSQISQSFNKKTKAKNLPYYHIFNLTQIQIQSKFFKATEKPFEVSGLLCLGAMSTVPGDSLTQCLWLYLCVQNSHSLCLLNNCRRIVHVCSEQQRIICESLLSLFLVPFWQLQWTYSKRVYTQSVASKRCSLICECG